MKRFLSVAILLMACLPVGVSIVGCGTNVSNFCDATDTKRTSEVAVILLQPEFTPISMQYQQTRLVATPAATNCLGANVSVPKYSWASSNPLLVDISPTGNLCSGTWNRNTGGGIADYTICSSPSTQTIESLLQASGGSSYAGFKVTITASANGISSNPVTVYSHPQVTSAVGYTVPGTSGTGTAACTNPDALKCDGSTPQSSVSPSQCYSTAAQSPITYCALVCAEALTEVACANGQTAPCYGTQPTDVTAAAGEVTFVAANSSVVNINTDGVALPVFPGATLVTASVSGVTAAAGIYSTCAPASMKLSVADSTASVISVPVNQSKTLQLAVTDSTGEPITLSGLIYTSTSPQTLGISATGVVAPFFGGNGDVYAACLPPTCNPSPLDDIGLFATTSTSAAVSGGNGVPLVSNPINVATPGTETSIGYIANFDEVDYPNSNYIGVFNSQSGSVVPVSTKWRPNSMVLSQDYSRLYVGSDLGLMTFNAAPGTITDIADNITMRGRVIALSPDGTTLIISGQTEEGTGNGSPVIYLYLPATGAFQTFSGTAYSARWSADSTTAYIAGGSQEYVYSRLTGWSIYPTSTGETDVEDVTVLAPPVGALFSGENTAVRNYCSQPGTNPVAYNPLQPGTGVTTERLGISTDGLHVFGATSAGSFDDFCIGIPTLAGTTTTGACQPAPVSPIAACSPTFAVAATPTASSTAVPAGFNVSGIPVATQAVTTGAGTAATTSTAYTAFVTYSNCSNTESTSETCTGAAPGGGVLPYYAINDAGTPTAATLTLTNPGSPVAPVAPTAGAISPDGSTAYIATSGDNALHLLAINALTGVPTENVTSVPPIAIGIPSGTGANTFLPADKIVVRPNRAN